MCFCYSKEELNQAEYDLSVFLNVVESDDWYNVVYGGGSVSGYHHTEETKRHLSNILSGENSPHYGKCLPKEQRDKIREKAKLRTGEKNPFYGKHHTEETKEKLRNISYGQNMSEETRTKISNALKGRPSPNKGKPSPNKGKKLSDEKKKQLSILCLERGNNSGKNNPRSIPIVQLSSDGEFIAEWEYTKQAAIALGVDNSSLSKAVKNHSLFKGYWWIKLEEYSNIDINSLNKK